MIVRILLLLVLAVLVVGCSPPPGLQDAPVAPPRPTLAPGEQEKAVAAFTGYYAALAARDYPRACALLADNHKAALIEKMSVGANDITCERAYAKQASFAALSNTAERDAAIARSIRVDEVYVRGADLVNVTCSADVGGRRVTGLTGGVLFRRGMWLAFPIV